MPLLLNNKGIFSIGEFEVLFQTIEIIELRQPAKGDVYFVKTDTQ